MKKSEVGCAEEPDGGSLGRRYRSCAQRGTAVLPSPANAFGHIQKVAICDLVGGRRADVLPQVDERGIDYNALIMEQLDL